MASGDGHNRTRGGRALKSLTPARSRRMTTSAYGVLGLPDGAAPKAVRQAYKRVVLTAHPDRVRPHALSALRRSRARSSRRDGTQGGTCAQFDRVQAAYATLSGAGLRRPRPRCHAAAVVTHRGANAPRAVLWLAAADPDARAAHDDALRAAGAALEGGNGARAVTVHGQTCGRALSQRGVVRGVTVVTHGQTGPPPQARAPAPAPQEPPLTEAECAAREEAAVRNALAAGDAALAAGDHAAAVSAYTTAVRSASAGGYAAAAAHAGRADAWAAAGDWRRALADAEEAVALEPGSAAAHARCGRAWAALDEHDEAARAFNAAARLGDTAAAGNAAASMKMADMRVAEPQ